MLDGKDAVAEGLIDRLGSLSDALDELYTLINERAHEAGEDPGRMKGDG